MALPVILFALSALPYSYCVLHDQGKAIWSKNLTGFFGENQYLRKYKLSPSVELAPNNWYYRFFKIKYREAFPLSTTFLISGVDAYHACQALMRLLMSLSLTLAIGANWWFAGLIWALYATIHWAGYKFLSR